MLVLTTEAAKQGHVRSLRFDDAAGRPRPARRWLVVVLIVRVGPTRVVNRRSAVLLHATRSGACAPAAPGYARCGPAVAQAPDQPVLTSPGRGRSGAVQVAQTARQAARPLPVAQQRGTHPARRRGGDHRSVQCPHLSPAGPRSTPRHAQGPASSQRAAHTAEASRTRGHPEGQRPLRRAGASPNGCRAQVARIGL